MKQQEIYLIRHAESMFNIGMSNDVDVGLTEQGINQASQLDGYYDVIICSPLKRCIDTLTFSNIRYGLLSIDPIVREVIREQSDMLLNENFYVETEENIFERIGIFKIK